MTGSQEIRADGWQHDTAQRNTTIAGLARENRQLRTQLAESQQDQDAIHADLSELLDLLGLGTHARPQSPHQVFQTALTRLRERLEFGDRTEAWIRAAERERIRQYAAGHTDDCEDGCCLRHVLDDLLTGDQP